MIKKFHVHEVFTSNVKFIRRISGFFALFFCVTFYVSATASEQYFVFKDKHGKTVIQDTIPPEYADKGYRIVNEQGVTIKKVAPVKYKRIERVPAKKKPTMSAKDMELLQMYSSEADIEETKQRKISALDTIIDSTSSKIKIFERNLSLLYQRRISLQSENDNIPAKLIQDIHTMEEHVAENKVYVEKKKQERLEEMTRFDAEKNRFRELAKGLKN